MTDVTFAGQAFTKYTCKNCGNDFMHHNTNTPRLCKECFILWADQKSDEALEDYINQQ